MLSEVCVRIGSSADIVAARQRGRELAEAIGFTPSGMTLVATAISEIARNIIDYADSGEVLITPVRNGTKQGLKIVATDRGPGIADVARVMRDGYSTGDGLGIGLPGTKRLMDEFEITSTLGKGTIVTMKKWAE
jgi:serine/threonine-protein kinase RsbT